MSLINAFAKSNLSPEQVYTFAVRLCDNEIDRDWERFDYDALEKLSRLFIGKTGIFDHNWSAQGQTARLYQTELCYENSLTLAGDRSCFLKGYAYMLRNEKNRDLIAEIEAGIKKEVSIGCSVAKRVCSICGREDGCGHQGGESYGGQLCFFSLQDPTDAYEWSFVAVPAQRKAGVIKTFSQDTKGGLKRFLANRPDCLRELEALEKDAQLGRSYMNHLRNELVRLAGLADESLDMKIFSQAASKLDEQELLELSKVYRRRLDQLYPPTPQLHAPTPVAPDSEDSAFLI